MGNRLGSVDSARRHLPPGDRRLLGAGALLTGATAATDYVHAGRIVPFVVAGVALGVLAAIVGRSVDRLGDRLGSGDDRGGAVRARQPARAVRRDLRPACRPRRCRPGGPRRLDPGQRAPGARRWPSSSGAFATGPSASPPRPRGRSSLLLVLAASIVIDPDALFRTSASPPHPRARALRRRRRRAARRVRALDPGLAEGGHGRRRQRAAMAGPHAGRSSWCCAALLGSSVAAAFVSDWFVAALTPALSALHISQAFAGLVVVAIAGNAVENVVGIKLAAQQPRRLRDVADPAEPGADRARADPCPRPLVERPRRSDAHAGDAGDARGIARHRRRSSPSSSCSTASRPGSRASPSSASTW